jgi:ribosomal protein L17
MLPVHRQQFHHTRSIPPMLSNSESTSVRHVASNTARQRVQRQGGYTRDGKSSFVLFRSFDESCERAWQAFCLFALGANH